MQNRMFFVLLRPILREKWKIAPPIRKQPPLKRLNLRNWTKCSVNFGEDLFWRSPNFGRKKSLNFEFRLKNTLNFGEVRFFFFRRSPNFGRKKPLNFGLRPKNHSEFWRRPFFFFGGHLSSGAKNLGISELSETFRLNFRTIRLKLIQDQ